jgi:cytochrome c556
MRKILIGLAVASLSVAGVAAAQDEPPFKMEIKARQGIMNYRALNIGVLAAMAKGEAEYDAAKAKAAADNIVATNKLDASMLWPPGSDNAANSSSTAAASIWAEGSDIGALSDKFNAAADAMAAAAGTDLAALQGAMEPLGAACAACHKAHRIPTN